jgi:CheY-like chemotaxis protein
MPERLRLLLAEDDEVDVMNIQRALEKLGLPYPLHVARDGQEALDELRSGRVPRERLLVILDLYMPRLGGLETLQAIRNDPELTSLPVVLLTTSQDEQVKLDAYHLNVAGYLRKPFDRLELGHQLEVLCNYWSAIEMP